MGAKKSCLVIGEDSRNRVHSAGQCLAEDEDVRVHAVVLARQHAAGAAEAALHLVSDQQRIVLAQQLVRARQVAGVRDHYARLTLHMQCEPLGISGVEKCSSFLTDSYRTARAFS